MWFEMLRNNNISSSVAAATATATANTTASAQKRWYRMYSESQLENDNDFDWYGWGRGLSPHAGKVLCFITTGKCASWCDWDVHLVARIVSVTTWRSSLILSRKCSTLIYGISHFYTAETWIYSATLTEIFMQIWSCS